MPLTETSLKVFEATRTILATPESWAQRIMYDSNDGRQHCIVGGLRSGFETVQPEFGWPITEVEKSNELKLLAKFTRPAGVTHWNDDPERTHEDILALLDRAIEHTKRELEILPAEMK